MLSTRRPLFLTGTGLFLGLSAALADAQCQTWQPGFHLAGTDSEVNVLRVYDDGHGTALFTGGTFTRTGGVSASRIARWDGTTWSPLGGGITGNVTPTTATSVNALTPFDDGQGVQLYAAGSFTTAGGVPARNIARWDGATWSTCLSSMTTTHPSGSTTVMALTTFDDGTGPALYAAGEFDAIDGVTMNRIAKWNGTSWQSLAGGVDGSVWSMVVFDDGTGPALYACGGFQHAGGVAANFVAKWDGVAWSPLGAGTWGGAYVLCVFDDGTGPALFAGGNFTQAGGQPAARIAKWDGTNWTTLGAGIVSGQVHSLAVHDDGSGSALYAGGLFNATGGSPGQFIARWDGTTWSALGSGLDQRVSAMATFDDGGGPALYTGGRFQIAGGNEALRIAKWRGATWSRVGDGNGLTSTPSLDASVSKLVAFDDGSGPGLFAGGGFQTAGGVWTANVARWNGLSWSPLGSGMSNGVASLAIFDDGTGSKLFAGGLFVTAGGVTVNRIAKWDGSNWSPLGLGVGSSNTGVLALAAGDIGAGPRLFAGGTFTTAGGNPANKLAAWDGTNWTTLGAGVFGSGSKGGSYVTALAVFDDGAGPEVYAAGSFVAAGSVLAADIARWNGTTWSALGSGLQNTAEGLFVYDDGTGPALYVTGYFSNAGGVPGTGGIARWKNSTWSSVGGGLDYPGGGMTAFDDGTGMALYVGGEFSHAGGVPAENIAKWNGTTWSALGSGLGSGASGDMVRAVAGFDAGLGGGPDLYAGGRCRTAGALFSDRIAVWKGCGGSVTSSCTPGSGTICPCAGTAPANGCTNSVSAAGSQFVHSGNPSIANDSLVLTSSLVPDGPGLYFQSSGLVSVPFGDGVLCAGTGIVRMGVVFAAGGTSSYPGGLTPSPIHVAGSASVGDVRHYQMWYRDADPNFCTSAFFNLTSVLTATWKP